MDDPLKAADAPKWVAFRIARHWCEGLLSPAFVCWRVKQIIIRGGSNISPQEVEEALYHHPAVMEAGVIGMPDPVHGERVIAFVALREGLTADEQELRNLVRSRIADYKTRSALYFCRPSPKDSPARCNAAR